MASKTISALAELLRRPLWQPYPWQTQPGQLGAQELWLIEGGRGIGKTDGCARAMDRHAQGPACDPRIPGGHRMAIVAPTLDDAAESCVNGPSGLRTHNPGVQLKVKPGGTFAIWPNGAQAKLFGAHTPSDVDRLRAGGNRCFAWMEECAAQRYLEDADAMMRMGLRLGPTPHIVASSTPRPTRQYKEFRKRARYLTHGTTEQAYHLDPAVRAALYSAYQGKTLGKQELGGVLLDAVEGALWELDLIDLNRVVGPPSQLDRVCVAVDPSASKAGDEVGIVATGRVLDRFYVLDDRSGHYSPEEWGEQVIDTYLDWSADLIVAERNQGGDMVRSVIRTAWREAKRAGKVDGPEPRIKLVHAKAGKRLRADPVSQLYGASVMRVHHCGVFARLEDQMTTWVPGQEDSPDRVDALVYGIRELDTPAGLELVVR